MNKICGNCGEPERVTEHVCLVGAPRTCPPRFPLSPEAALVVAYVVEILSAIQVASGNTAAAALALGMSRRTLDAHVDRLGFRALQTATWSRSERQPR